MIRVEVFVFSDLRKSNDSKSLQDRENENYYSFALSTRNRWTF